jgi:hypothetical protein
MPGENRVHRTSLKCSGKFDVGVSSLDPEKLKNRIKIREKYNDLPST